MPGTPANTFLAALIASAERQSSERTLRLVQELPAKPKPMPKPMPIRQPEKPRTNILMSVWSWLNRKVSVAPSRQLRVTETVSLGEKRFVAVVQVDGRKFLIGGGSSGVSLLTQLGPSIDTNATAAAAMGMGGLPE